MAISTLAPVAGTEGRISINGAALNLNYWKCTPVAADTETTNFESGIEPLSGLVSEEHLTTKVRCDVECRGMWDASQNPWLNPPNLAAGVLLTTVNLFIRKTGGRKFIFPFLYVLQCPVEGTAQQGAFTFSMTAKSHGSWTYPA